MRAGRLEISRGFTIGEMVFLLLLTGVFLVGVVWIVDSGVGALGSVENEETAGGEAEEVLVKIGALVTDGRAAFLSRQSPESVIDILVDLDGDDGTGGYSVGETKGLERVKVARGQSGGNSLVAEVYEYPGREPDEVLLTESLQGGDPDAFRVDYMVGEEHLGTKEITDGREVTGMSVSLSLVVKGAAERARRSFQFRNAPIELMEEDR